MSEAHDWGAIAEARLVEIGSCSLTGEGVTRLPFTAEHVAANRLITGWMEQSGMAVSMDAAGTLIGRIEGSGPRSGLTFILGSHQDSVRNGGRFDGIMGVALACLAVEQAFGRETDPDFSIEVHAYADEEGVRFPTALLGPRALAGSFDPTVLEMIDTDGTSLREAIRRFGGKPEDIITLKRNGRNVLGYLEIHIEQGPVLEREDLATGVVTSICGIERISVTISGKTGHAGTVPMKGRRDALVPAARIISENHRRAVECDEVRATIGTLSILPGAVNQIPESVSFLLEIRSPDDAVRANFKERICEFSRQVAGEHDCGISIEQTYVQPAQMCDPQIISHLCTASGIIQGRAHTLPSGATHDASAIADLCPIGMLFVRCRDGVSHVPDEYASPKDMGQAVEISARFLRAL